MLAGAAVQPADALPMGLPMREVKGYGVGTGPEPQIKVTGDPVLGIGGGQ